MSARASSNATVLSRGMSGTVFTAMGWFYRVAAGDPGGSDSILALGDANNVINMFTNVAAGVYGLFDGGADNNSTVSIVNNQWHHFAVTVASLTGAVIMYIDGKQVASGTATSMTAIATMWLMGDATGGAGNEWFNGRVAQVKVYTAVLTAAQIQQEMQSVNAVLAANLNGLYWIKAGLSRTADTSGNNNNLTDTGPTTDELDINAPFMTHAF